MGMAAEHALCAASPAVGQCPSGHLGGKAKPHGIKSFQETYNLFLPKRNLLQGMMECRKEIAEKTIVHEETIELVAMNR